jgi:serine/threonine protein phosphatase PrpC
MIPAERAHLHIAALTHPGMSGKNNEDRYAVSAFRLEDEQPTPAVFAIISDGIGGHRAGEVAAEMVVETVSQAVANSNAQYPMQTLREAIMRSSQEISVEAESDPDKKGMGATCACSLIVGERLYTAYVGDSRIYLLRSGNIRQISIDHTWIQEAIDAGIIEPEEGKGHPNAHVIRRYLGSKQPVEPDTRLRFSPTESAAQSEANQGLLLLPGDQVILCSDGLTDLVSDTEILIALQNNEQPAALQVLVDLANQRGGHDNITVIALRLPALVPNPEPDTLIITPQAVERLPQTPQSPRVPQPSAVQSRPRKAAIWLLPVIGLVLLVLVALVIGGLYWVYSGSVSTLVANTALPLVSQPVTLPVQVTAAPASTSAATSQSNVFTPTAQAGTPFIPTPVITLTPWPTNTRSPGN